MDGTGLHCRDNVTECAEPSQRRRSSERSEKPKPSRRDPLVQTWAQPWRDRPDPGTPSTKQSIRDTNEELSQSDRAIHEARQSAVQDTPIFNDAGQLIALLKPHQQNLPAQAPTALARKFRDHERNEEASDASVGNLPEQSTQW